MPDAMYLDWLVSLKKESGTFDDKNVIRYRPPPNYKADNPFKDLGYETEVLTHSNGKYIEDFDLDSLERIGAAVYNWQKERIAGFVLTDTIYSEYSLEPEIISRWLSPDPLADEFPSWSPYNYTEGNPVLLIDPDGRAARLPGETDDPNAFGPGGLDDIGIPKPLSTYRLREIARENGFTGSGVQFNRKVGKAFEELALRSITGSGQGNTARFPSNERARRSAYSSVIPDWVGPVIGAPCNTCAPSTYSNSMFIEVKAKAGFVSASTSNHQITGYLDIAQNAPAKNAPGATRPAIYFVTTSNTHIGPSVILDAMKRGVHVFQMTAYEMDGKIGFTPPRLLTPDSRVHIPNVLTILPRELSFPVYSDPPNDPDPEIVD
jgi:hypothetical protein